MIAQAFQFHRGERLMLSAGHWETWRNARLKMVVWGKTRFACGEWSPYHAIGVIRCLIYYFINKHYISRAKPKAAHTKTYLAYLSVTLRKQQGSPQTAMS
jgi:hypothetical protein